LQFLFVFKIANNASQMLCTPSLQIGATFHPTLIQNKVTKYI